MKDSERLKASSGDNVKLQVANAATPREVAKIYPAGYWTALIHPPAKEELPPVYHSQEQWLAAFRAGCNQCHQIGMVAMRGYTNAKVWDTFLRLNSGMNRAADTLGRDLLEKTLVDWATRIQDGEVPPAPPRPIGIERNFVVSQWDWAIFYPRCDLHG